MKIKYHGMNVNFKEWLRFMFYIGPMDYGFAWGIRLFGKVVYFKKVK